MGLVMRLPASLFSPVRLTSSCCRLSVVAALLVAASLVVAGGSVVAQGGFSDLDEAGSHRAGIENLAGMGVLEGTECAEGEFCPTDPLKRWVMAVWLVRVLDGADPVGSGSRFSDVDADTWWAPFVERLAVLGVTAGCATDPDRYCPDDSVTRAQMATFLTRAFDLESAPSFGFVDTEGNTHAVRIDALAAAGVTVGCATDPDRYCPDDSVTRAQMATFLTRALGISPLSVSIDSDTSRTVAGDFKVTVSFPRSVTGLGLADIEVVNGRASGLAGSGSNYEATVIPAAEGTVVVRVLRGAARDATGNHSQASALLVRDFRSDGGRGGPGFDVWDRQAVVGAYRAEFEREEPDHGFTGDVATCDAGTTSQPFRDSIVQRVNWYRQMAGLDTVTEKSEYSAAAQQAALMMAAQGRLSHYPGSDWACYTENGALGARSSNLGSTGEGTYGIDRYMRDQGANNVSVGHRRWILHPRMSQIGTGNIPHDASSRSTGNALYVVGANIHGTRPDVREPRGFVAWPPAGYVPSQTVWGRWSFQLGGANFDSAAVTVTDDYGLIPVEVIARKSGGGAPEPSIVWAVHGDGNSQEFPRFPDQDYCYTVTISNVTVAGTVQTPFQYATCLIDPSTENESRGTYLSPPVWSPDGAQITYVRDWGRWIINSDGSNQRLLLLSGEMRWSPDSTRIAYTGVGIWVMDADGANQQRITAKGYSPAWSPDGAQIAYSSFTGIGWSAKNNGIWVMDADGANQRQLATNGSSPDWSPDGTRISYTNSGIWVMNADGTGQRQLTEWTSTRLWSADSTRIIYGYGSGTWSINADGTNQHQLASIGPPAWSPDGARIAYTDNGIWIANIDGTDPQQLTTSGSSPAWSPDGARIAYNEWGHQLWVVNADGTGQHQLSK